MELGAWGLALSAVPAGKLEAWRLLLGAYVSPREARHNILGGKMSSAAIIHFFVVIVEANVIDEGPGYTVPAPVSFYFFCVGVNPDRWAASSYHELTAHVTLLPVD